MPKRRKNKPALNRYIIGPAIVVLPILSASFCSLIVSYKLKVASHQRILVGKGHAVWDALEAGILAYGRYLGERISNIFEELPRAYEWPRNLRELCNAMERAAILAHDSLILPNDLPPRIRQVSPGSSALASDMGEIRRRTIIEALEKSNQKRTGRRRSRCEPPQLCLQTSQLRHIKDVALGNVPHKDRGHFNSVCTGNKTCLSGMKMSHPI